MQAALEFPFSLFAATSWQYISCLVLLQRLDEYCTFKPTQPLNLMFFSQCVLPIKTYRKIIDNYLIELNFWHSVHNAEQTVCLSRSTHIYSPINLQLFSQSQTELSAKSKKIWTQSDQANWGPNATASWWWGLGASTEAGCVFGCVCVCKLVRHRWRHQSWQTRLPWWRRPSSGNSWINSNNNNENINRVTGKQDEGERASTAGQLCVREAHKALNTVSSTLFHWIQLKGEIENWNSIKML